ncbi:uncharacterized protein LOC135804812 [Sycon ciliatum]|uniref:uncharacterized protein LOC135804812 n=1 Tax=Sycon ciliatum TaxID=27933 RepID=UPI0031F601DE
MARIGILFTCAAFLLLAAGQIRVGEGQTVSDGLATARNITDTSPATLNWTWQGREHSVNQQVATVCKRVKSLCACADWNHTLQVVLTDLKGIIPACATSVSYVILQGKCTETLPSPRPTHSRKRLLGGEVGPFKLKPFVVDKMLNSRTICTVAENYGKQTPFMCWDVNLHDHVTTQIVNPMTNEGSSVDPCNSTDFLRQDLTNQPTNPVSAAPKQSTNVFVLFLTVLAVAIFELW